MVAGKERQKMADRYYIAYGSNLSIEQMKFRTPDAQIVGTALLDGWRLLFRGYATIKKNSKFKTPVLIWKISAQDEKNLDHYEGFPRFYIKKDLNVAVTSLDGQDLGNITAMVYIMTARAVKNRSLQPMPSSNYYSILSVGYETFSFDKRILEAALLEAFNLSKRLSNQPTTALA